MIPAQDAAFLNAGSGPVNFAMRPAGGTWNNNYQLNSRESIQPTFGTSQFEIVLVSSGDVRIQKTLACGQEYVIFFDSGNQRWDIMLARDYH